MPAYGQFTGYVPVAGVPGAYDFQTPGGSRRFVGPAAEDMRKRIDAARIPDLRTAANDVAADPNVASDFVRPTPGVASGGLGGLSNVATAASRAQDAGIQAALGGATAPAPPPVQMDPIASTESGGMVYQLRNADGSLGALEEHEPARRATKGGLVQRGQSVQGVQDIDEATLAAMDQQQMQLDAGRMMAREQAASDAEMLQSYAQERDAKLAQQAEAAARQQEEIAGRVREFEQRYVQAEKDFADFKLDPKKAAGGDVGKVVGAIAKALGALGASLARTPNFAAETVRQNIENNLAAQKAEWQVKREMKDNLYAQLQERLGSQAAASDAFRAIMSQRAENKWASLAMKTKNSQEQAELFEHAAQARMGYLQYREKMLREAGGEISKTFAYQQAQAGAPATKRLASLDTQERVAKLKGTFATTDKTRADADAARAKAAGGGTPVSQPQLDALTGAANTIVASSKILGNLERMGAIDSGFDDPLAGTFDKAKRSLSSASGGEYSQQADALEADTILMAKGMQSAFGKSDRDAEDAERMATGSKATGKQRARAAEQAASRAMTVLKQQLVNMTPAQRQQQLNALPAEVRQALSNE